jgi:membrane protein DedA with SNARE-associated domain
MTTVGGVVKGVLIFFCGYYLFVAMVQALSGQTALSAFMFVGFLIPLTYVIYGYAKDKPRKTKNPPTTN